MLSFLYNSVLGRLILKALTRPFISKSAGYFMETRLSVPFIKPFIRRNNISLEDFDVSKWKSFNEFFVRPVKTGAREFDPDKNALLSPCDGLLTVYQIEESLTFSVKNSLYSIEALLENSSLAREYLGGLCLIFRLTPAHYHRYHYFDNGTKGENIYIKGVLHTVQPVATENIPVYTRNSREYTVLKTESFGEVVFMEVGAMLVGKICNHHKACSFARGQEKGYFKFGGSTVILLLKKDRARIYSSILAENENQQEFSVKAGQKIGEKLQLRR